MDPHVHLQGEKYITCTAGTILMASLRTSLDGFLKSNESNQSPPSLSVSSLCMSSYTEGEASKSIKSSTLIG